VRQGGFEPPS